MKGRNKLQIFFFNRVNPDEIISINSIAMQVGDSYKIRSKVLPDGFGFTAKLSSDSENIMISNENIIAKKEGTANLILSSGKIEKKIPIHIGTQIINTKELSFLGRNIKDIILTEIPDHMYVGDEYALEGIGISADGIPWDWYNDANEINYLSNDTNIATIQFGVIKAIKEGTAKITAENIDKTITKTFEVKILKKENWWESLTEEEIYKPEIVDSSFEGFQHLIDTAKSSGFKKVIIPENIYVLDPKDTPISLVNDFCIDFNNSKIMMKENNEMVVNNTPYITFEIRNKKNCIFMNGTFYGENYYQYSEDNISPHHIEHEVMLNMVGSCDGTHIINCEFSYSPGFNVIVDNERVYKTRQPLKLNNIEAGSINEDGSVNIDNTDGVFRTINYISLKTLINKTFCLGNFQGYSGWPYMYSRLYNIYFYNETFEFISCLKYCKQYSFYEKPENAIYCKIEFFQSSKPTECDPDFGGIAHIVSVNVMKYIYIENCTFKNCVSTGLIPSGDGIIVDNCVFENCGSIDPAASIDWEDYGQTCHSCIIRNCVFGNTIGKGYCALRSVASNSLTMHDNIFNNTELDIRSSSEWFRIYHNYCNCDVNLNSKYSSIFAGNEILSEPTVGLVEGAKSNIYIIDNTVSNYN